KRRSEKGKEVELQPLFISEKGDYHRRKKRTPKIYRKCIKRRELNKEPPGAPKQNGRDHQDHGEARVLLLIVGHIGRSSGKFKAQASGMQYYGDRNPILGATPQYGLAS